MISYRGTANEISVSDCRARKLRTVPRGQTVFGSRPVAVAVVASGTTPADSQVDYVDVLKESWNFNSPPEMQTSVPCL